MNAKPTPPIFIACVDGDLLVFDSCDEAESYVESVDVEGGEHVAVFDAAGTRLAIDVLDATKRTRFLGVTAIALTPVRVRPQSEQGAAEGELQALLAGRLHGASGDVPLPELVERVRRELAAAGRELPYSKPRGRPQ